MRIQSFVAEDAAALEVGGEQLGALGSVPHCTTHGVASGK